MNRLSSIVFPFLWFFLAVLPSCPQAEPSSPLRQRQFRSGTEAAVEKWQADLRQELRGILHIEDLWESKDRIPLDPRILATTEEQGYVFRDMEISSTPGRRIRVVTTTPTGMGEGPFPAVVCIHGHGGNRYSTYDKASIYKGFATDLASRGAVTIAVDVGQHTVYEEGRILMGERLWDLVRCVDCLESLPQVDPARIGCAGLSLGGEMVMWLGALDTRMAASVSCGFLTVMDQMEQNHCPCWKFPGLRERVDYADIYALIAPRALQCQNGEREPENDFTPAIARQALAEIEPAYSDLGAPGKVELLVHPGAHEVDLPGLLRFFEEHLRL